MNNTGAEDVQPVEHDVSTRWSIPPVLSPNPDNKTDPSFVITQGIIYKVENKGNFQFQIQATNKELTEGATIGISRHGNENGKWVQLEIGAIIKISGNFYLLNQSNVWNITIVPI